MCVYIYVCIRNATAASVHNLDDSIKNGTGRTITTMMIIIMLRMKYRVWNWHRGSSANRTMLKPIFVIVAKLVGSLYITGKTGDRGVTKGSETKGGELGVKCF